MLTVIPWEYMTHEGNKRLIPIASVPLHLLGFRNPGFVRNVRKRWFSWLTPFPPSLSPAPFAFHVYEPTVSNHGVLHRGAKEYDL